MRFTSALFLAKKSLDLFDRATSSSSRRAIINSVSSSLITYRSDRNSAPPQGRLPVGPPPQSGGGGLGGATSGLPTSTLCRWRSANSYCGWNSLNRWVWLERATKERKASQTSSKLEFQISQNPKCRRCESILYGMRRGRQLPAGPRKRGFAPHSGGPGA